VPPAAKLYLSVLPGDGIIFCKESLDSPKLRGALFWRRINAVMFRPAVDVCFPNFRPLGQKVTSRVLRLRRRRWPHNHS